MGQTDYDKDIVGSTADLGEPFFAFFQAEATTPDAYRGAEVGRDSEYLDQGFRVSSSGETGVCEVYDPDALDDCHG